MKRESTSLASLPAWAKLNGITLHGVAFQHLHSEDDGSDKGAAVVAAEEKISDDARNDNPSAQAEILMRIPMDAILSLEGVNNYAKSDRYLRDVLEAVGDFGRTARGAILLFLIIQTTYSSPDFAEERQKIGVSNPWTEYIKFLPPSIPLPTFYTEEESELLRGTSLRLAVDAKNASLEREFDHLRESTEGIAWCQRCWWNEETGKLTLDDWEYADAVYRSRTVELPGLGDCMVPCVDMVNHVSGGKTNSFYEVDGEGNVVLQLRRGKGVQVGQEVTISYGDEKPAAEMVFSYGFLENGMSSARRLFLDLDIPDDCSLKLAKKVFCKDAPGVVLFENPSNPEHTGWDSALIWWACVYEDDGLDFEVLQTTDGEKELRASWKGEVVENSARLRDLLAADPLWDIYQLRAVVLLLERFTGQSSVLGQTKDVISEACRDEDTAIFRPEVFSTVSKLRKLEGELLSKGCRDLTEARDQLMASETVTAYLKQQAEGYEEDFS